MVALALQSKSTMLNKNYNTFFFFFIHPFQSHTIACIILFVAFTIYFKKKEEEEAKITSQQTNIANIVRTP